MKERLTVWGARAIISLPLTAALVFVGSRPEHHTHNYFPFGHLHYFAESVGMLAFYGCAGALALACGCLLVAEFCLTLKVVWLTAWRRPHHPWRHRWKEDKSDIPKVRYETKPEPLIKGKIGTR